MVAVQMFSMETGEILQFIATNVDRAMNKVKHLQDPINDEVYSSVHADWRIVIIKINSERSWEEINKTLKTEYSKINWEKQHAM